MRTGSKSVVLAALALSLGAFPALGQVEVTPTIGYQFGGFLESSNFKYTLSDEINFGGILGFDVSNTSQVELVFDYASPDVNRRDKSTDQTERVGGTKVWSLHLGGLYDIPSNGGVQPFLSGGLGFTTFDPSDFGGTVGEIDATTKFSANLAGGAKLGSEGPVGLRLMSRLWIVNTGAGSGFWCGSAGGCVIAGGASVILRMELIAALSFKTGGR